MTFELSPDLLEARERARTLAAAEIQPLAAAIDRDAAVPDAVARAAEGAIVARDALSLVVTVEEIAAASGAVALNAALPGRSGAALGLAGLRGAVAIEDSPRAQLALAAVALGLGRAALQSALGMLKEATANRGTHTDAPHWVVADVATEIDGARLLAYKAAQSDGREDAASEIAMARLLASGAAGRAVDAALRIAGAEGYRDGAPLERLARDIRAVAVLHGTEERQRAQAAEGLLPQG
jgi:alkylation response protein AidB-like acyl-CoA dehydrogenase